MILADQEGLVFVATNKDLQDFSMYQIGRTTNIEAIMEKKDWKLIFAFETEKMRKEELELCHFFRNRRDHETRKFFKFHSNNHALAKMRLYFNLYRNKLGKSNTYNYYNTNTYNKLDKFDEFK